MGLGRWQWWAIAAGAIALLVMCWRGTEVQATFGAVYAFDTGTGRLFPTNDLPPMPAPSGADAGVLAHAVVFAGDSSPTVIYLLTYTERARDILRNTGGVTAEVSAGTLVRRPADHDWTPAYSTAGQQIRDSTAELAAGRSWMMAIPNP